MTQINLDAIQAASGNSNAPEKAPETPETLSMEPDAIEARRKEARLFLGRELAPEEREDADDAGERGGTFQLVDHGEHAVDIAANRRGL